MPKRTEGLSLVEQAEMMVKIGERIHRLRVRHNISAHRVAERTSLSNSVYLQIEKGRVHKVSVFSLYDIAKAINRRTPELILIQFFTDDLEIEGLPEPNPSLHNHNNNNNDDDDDDDEDNNSTTHTSEGFLAPLVPKNARPRPLGWIDPTPSPALTKLSDNPTNPTTSANLIDDEDDDNEEEPELPDSHYHELIANRRRQRNIDQGLDPDYDPDADATIDENSGLPSNFMEELESQFDSLTAELSKPPEIYIPDPTIPVSTLYDKLGNVIEQEFTES